MTEKKTRGKYKKAPKPEVIKKPVGAPAFEYTPELASRICDEIASTHLSLKKICLANPDFPNDKLIYQWLFKYPEFNRQYDLAKELQQMVCVESQDEIFDWASKQQYYDKGGSERIDGGAVALAKLRADNIKWTAARLNRKFRDKVEIKGIEDKKRTVEEVRAEMKKLKKYERQY
jgi:hypothetical protein